MRPLAPRERKLVAVGLLVAVGAVLWLGLLSPYLDSFQRRARQRQQLLARYAAGQRLLDAAPTLRVEAAEQRRSSARFKITAPSRETASSALRQRLASVLTEAGGSVATVQDAQADAGLDRVSARADAVMTYSQFVAGLRRLENEEPYVVVDYTALGADRALHAGHAAPLDVRLQISAVFYPASAR
jgi:hypothetical protein